MAPKYAIGFGKPPKHSKFKKGQSGNPGGRPRRLAAERLEELALYEAYRTTIVMDDTGTGGSDDRCRQVVQRRKTNGLSDNRRRRRNIRPFQRDLGIVQWHVAGRTICRV